MASPRKRISTVRVAAGAAAAVLLTVTLLPPAKAQFWGDSWGGRQRQQQNNPFGGWGWGDRGGWENRQYRDRDYREYRGGEIQIDSSRAPAPTPKKDTTVPVVVMGDSMADWLAYGLEEAYSEKPDVGIVRKLRSDSGLIRYDLRRDTIDWAQAAREIIAAEKPKFIVMMVGNNDRQTIREKPPAVVRPAPGAAKQGQPQGQGAKPGAAQGQVQPPAEPGPPVDAELERPATPEPPPVPNTEAARQAAYGPWEFRTEKWEAAYIKRIDATMAALKSAGVPVLWVGLPSRSNSKASADSSYLNEIYRSRAEKAGITYVDVWDGFVDEQGRYSAQGPDYEGQIRRLRTGDGVYFTKYGARKLAHYVEREIERYLANRPVSVALPVAVPPAETNPKTATPGARPNDPPPRPAAGPVLPLTVRPTSSEELLGGTRPPRQTPPSTDPTVARMLTKGEPVAAPIGRADDFSWPRGTAADEPAAVTPAAITALSKPPTAASPEGTPDAQQATDAQKAAEAQKRQQAARAPARESGPQRFLFNPQQWFRGFGRW